MLFIAHEFSLINLQTAFLPLIPCLLIQISLSYVLLTKDDNIKSCLFALIVLPIFVLLRLCEHCLWLFILCLTNFVYIINFIFETSLKAAQIPAAIGFLAFWFYYFLRAVEFENLSTVILITLFASTLSSIICTKRILFEEEFSKSMVNQVTIFVVSFVGFIGMLKCRFDPVHCTIIVGVTTTFIVALYSYYKLFLSSKFKLGTK